MSIAAQHFSIIKRPLLTEKTSALMIKGVYTFEVATDANKRQIKTAIETIWNVKVEGVRTINVKGELRRNRFGAYTTKGRRKAYITLKEGYVIELA